MVNLYNNHKNKNLQFKMDIVGIDPLNVSHRLILEGQNNIQLIYGAVNDKVCKFDVPILEGMEQGYKGRMYYEAIVGDDQYKKLWEEPYEVISNTEIKIVESNFEEEEEVIKPTIVVSSVSQVEEIKEEVKEEIEEESIVEETEEKVEENNKIEEKDIEPEIYNENESEESLLFSYDDFLKNKETE